MKQLLKSILPEKIKYFIRFLKRGSYSYFYWLFPLKKNKVVISNYYGKGYGDNGKYIVEEIIKQGLDIDIVWLLKKEFTLSSIFPSQVRTVDYGSFKALYELATAKVWIDNCRKMYSPPKRRGQYYIQTWHGGIPLKRVEKDVEDKLSSGYVQSAKLDSKMADLFISNSDFCTRLYKNSFWYEGKVLQCGTPRCDILIENSNRCNKKVRKYFNIDNNKKILVYAPTFRADYNTKVYDINFKMLIKSLEKKFGGEWNVLIRLHPNISYNDNIFDYDSEIINATSYEDMYELLSVSDILITDYSSTMFEFAFTKKPVFLYATDIESYIKDRNFYFDIRSLPFPLAEDNQQLFDNLIKFDKSEYLSNVSDFLSKLGVSENGDASSKIVKVINNLINKS